MPYCTMQCYTVLCYTIYAMPYCTILYHTILFYAAILYYTILYRGGQLKCATWSGVGGCPAGPLLYAIHTPHTCYIRIILGPLRAFPFRCPRAMTWCDRLPSWSAIPQFAPAMQLFWVKLATAQGHQNGLSGVGACGV